MSNVSVEQFSDVITSELLKYSAAKTRKINQAADTTIKKLVADSKNDAPVRTGDYKKAISSKASESGKYGRKQIWYVKEPYYRLAHLVEKGHATRKSGRSRPRRNKRDQTKAVPHINKNAEEAIAAFERAVKEVIKNGY